MICIAVLYFCLPISLGFSLRKEKKEEEGIIRKHYLYADYEKERDYQRKGKRTFLYHVQCNVQNRKCLLNRFALETPQKLFNVCTVRHMFFVSDFLWQKSVVN